MYDEELLIEQAETIEELSKLIHILSLRLAQYESVEQADITTNNYRKA